MRIETLRILLVEDNIGDTWLFRAAEPYTGGKSTLTVHCARTLREALRLLERRAHEIDAAVVDLRLPDAQGLDVVSQIRARYPRLPLVVLSGVEDERLEPTALARGAQTFLAKRKLSEESLARALHDALDLASEDDSADP